MSLQNLLKIRQLEEHETNSAQVSKMLDSANRNLSDAGQRNISPENRLDIAYRAIIQLAMVALWANGYRPATSKPGHHQTMIQSLVHSIGLDNDRMRVLDSFRGRRNAIDYTGESVDIGTVEACITSCEDLKSKLTEWLADNRQGLISLIGAELAGAMIAQQVLRHRSSKAESRFVFWITVVLNCGIFVWLFTDSGRARSQHPAVRRVLFTPNSLPRLVAVRDVAKARGISTVARDAGLGRESLYKTLKQGAQPRFETIRKPLNALGIKLDIAPKDTVGIG